MNTLLDVAIGLAVVYFLASMLCSSMQELLARFGGARGRLLREGLGSLLPDRWFYLRVIHHPLVSSLYRGRPGEGAPPSYLPGSNFALAVADTLLLRHRLQGATETPLTLQSLQDAVRDAKARDLDIGHALQPIVDAAPDLETALTRMETWFDTAMDRVSGWYKAYAQRNLFIIGLAVAVGFNIDTIQITGALVHSPGIRAAMIATATGISEKDKAEAAEAGTDPRAELRSLAKLGLPIGFACPKSKTTTGDTLMGKVTRSWECVNNSIDKEGNTLPLKLMGWLLTALATCLGAPFWFDAMKKLVGMRSAGPKPVRTDS